MTAEESTPYRHDEPWQCWYRYTIQNHPREEWHYEELLAGGRWRTLAVVKRYEEGGPWHAAGQLFTDLNWATIAAEREAGRRDGDDEPPPFLAQAAPPASREERNRLREALLQIGRLTGWVAWMEAHRQVGASEMRQIKRIAEEATGERFEVYE